MTTGPHDPPDVPFPAAGTSKDAHLAGAADLLNRDGPADAGFKLRGAEVAAVAGLSRSALYKLWPSMVDLADDARRFGATEYPDWRQTLLALSPDRPLTTNLAQALATDSTFIALAMRALLSTLPDDPCRQEVATADLRWFEDLGAWLTDHLSAVGRAPGPASGARELAISITAATEGAVMLRSMTAGQQRPFWRPEDDVNLGAIIARLVTAQTEAAQAVPVAPPPPGRDPIPRPTTTTWTERQRAVLTAVLRAADIPLTDPTSPYAVRLVDLAALARHLKVSRRRLEQLWPTTSDLNGDLFTFQARRLRATSEHLAGEAVLERLTAGDGLSRDMLFTVLESVIRTAITGDGAGLFAVAFAVGDPHLSMVAEQALAEWRHQQQVQFFALIHAFGYQLRPRASMPTLTSALFATTIGTMRIGLLNPQLMEDDVGPTGQQRPILVAAANAVLRTFLADGGGEAYPARDPVVVERPPPSHDGRQQDPPPI